MPRKRAPGAGRKPRGEFKGKTATLTTRITPETRVALEDAAKKSRLSLSQEVERRLVRSVAREHKRTTDVLGLAEAAAQVIEAVQETTAKRWRQDAFTGEAIRHGMDFLIRHFAAHGAPVIPPSVEKAAEEAAARGHIVDERDRSPAGIGEIAAAKVITLIEHFWGWNGNYARRVVKSLELFRYRQMLLDLGSGAERTQAALQEAQAALQEKERRR